MESQLLDALFRVGDLSNDETKRSEGLEIRRNQYQFAKVGFRGDDGDGHFTTKLARWETVGGSREMLWSSVIAGDSYFYAVLLLLR